MFDAIVRKTAPLALVAGLAVPANGSAIACTGTAVLTPADATRLASLGCLLTDRIVRLGAAGVHVPPPDREVTSWALTATGEQMVRVRVLADGTVQVESNDGRAAAAAVAVADEEPPECSLPDYAFWSPNAKSSPDRTYYWEYNGSNEPHDNYFDPIVVGGEFLTIGYNDCGLPMGEFGIRQYAAPAAAHRADFSGDDCRSGGNLVNTVDWGRIATAMARTCTWRIGLVCQFLETYVCPTESDIRFDTGTRWFIGPAFPEAGGLPEQVCRVPHMEGRDLVGLAVHEFGHVWGMDHVDVPYLTMTSAPALQCDFSRETLGKGDWNGLCVKWCQQDIAAAALRKEGS